MNDQTAALLQNLADKLGTTSQYLWSVLVKQAPISSFITIGEFALIAGLFLVLYRFRLAVVAFWRGWFETEDVTALIGACIFGITLIVLLMVCIFSFGSMVTGFLNPEYWALKEVLSAVKGK